MAVQEGILSRFPNANLAVEIVWVRILPADGPEAAQRASRMFADPRVEQLYDDSRVTSGSFVQGLISRPPAWDMYLFFPAHERWEGSPPQPADWLHQLGGGRGAPERFRTGLDLARGLFESTLGLGFAPAAPPPDEASYEAAVAKLANLR